MAASVQDIEGWFDRGIKQGSAFLIVVCDTFDYDDFPVYVDKIEDFWTTYNQHNNPNNMSRIMEVYDLSQSKEAQLASGGRAWNIPPKVGI